MTVTSSTRRRRGIAAFGLSNAKPVTADQIRPGMDVARLTAAGDGNRLETLRVHAVTDGALVSPAGATVERDAPGAAWFVLSDTASSVAVAVA